MLLPKSVTAVVEGEEPFNIPSTMPAYQNLSNMLIGNDPQKDAKVVQMLLDTRKTKAILFPRGVTQDADGTISVSGHTISGDLAEVFKANIEQGLSLDGLIQFVMRLKKNPSVHSRDMLYTFLKTNNHIIQSDGTFLAYKRVKSTFKDIYSNTFDNSPGTTVWMPREKVTEDPNTHCSSGLHVCAWPYLKEFGAPSEPIVVVAVPPEDVVSVPNDYDGSKMRVSSYKVLQVVTAPVTSEIKQPEVKEEQVMAAPKKKVKAIKKVLAKATPAPVKKVSKKAAPKKRVTNCISLKFKNIPVEVVASSEKDNGGTIRTSNFKLSTEQKVLLNCHFGMQILLMFKVLVNGKYVDQVASGKLTRGGATIYISAKKWNRDWGRPMLKSIADPIEFLVKELQILV